MGAFEKWNPFVFTTDILAAREAWNYQEQRNLLLSITMEEAGELIRACRGRVMKYAIMVPFDGDMLYVTEGDTKFHFQAKLFDTQEKALEHANLWGEHARVVEYTSESSRI